MFSTGDFEVSTGGGLISVGLGMMDDVAAGVFSQTKSGSA